VTGLGFRSWSGGRSSTARDGAERFWALDEIVPELAIGY
jgi:hypothetical protein